MDEPLVHLFRTCPEGKIIGIAKRNSVAIDNPASMEGSRASQRANMSERDR
jgi:hypothetical protein